MIAAGGSGAMREAQLNINGNPLSVRTAIPLKAGQNLTLQVDRLGPQIELKLVENKPTTPQLLQNGLRTVLPKSLGTQNIGQAMAQLQVMARPASGGTVPGGAVPGGAVPGGAVPG
ncbi:MAG: hypothetical protein ACLFSG_09035, partial [Halothiobacillaceae bacterium]